MSVDNHGLTEMQRRTVWWLANGHVGMSSKTMALWLAFGEPTQDRSHPHDPDDLDRCLYLLKAVPQLRQVLPRMAEVSPVWAALVARWDDIERSFLDEVGLGWSHGHSAPKTYRLMREVIEGDAE
jgi:UTP:GlnB (protein PII) uridylyltransferase